MKILFKHGHLVVDGNKEYLDGALLVEDETIKEVFVDSQSVKENIEVDEEIDLAGKIVMPGFFDTHTHGVNGISFNKATKAELDKAAMIYAKKGTTSFFSTLTYNEKIANTLNVLEHYEDKNARLLGIHLEGPFISPNKSGVANQKYILKPDVVLLNELLANSTKIKQMTIAPELKDSDLIINELRKNKINVMFGHTEALLADMQTKDYQGFTHLFNCCSPLHQRKIGVVNVAFTDESKYSEVIADGIHIDKNILKIILKNIPRNRVVLVSDSTELTGLQDGEYVFEGERCLKQGLLAKRIKDGALAGGASYINDGLKNMCRLGASLTDLLLMSSLNAYRLYHLDQRYGSLVKGKYADMVIMDEDLNVLSTFCKGRLINA